MNLPALQAVGSFRYRRARNHCTGAPWLPCRRLSVVLLRPRIIANRQRNTREAMHSIRKRLIAAAISLLVCPGLGHYLVGAPIAGAWWASAIALAFFSLIGACAFGGPTMFLLTLIPTLLLQILACADLLRQRDTPSPTPVRMVIVALVGFAILTGMKSITRVYFVEAFRIPGSSMYPNILEGDNILVSKVKRKPVRGDAIVFRHSNGMPYIKRVIAVAGDTIEIRENTVWLNRQPLLHAHSPDTCTLEGRCTEVYEAVDGRRYKIAIAESTTDGSVMSPQQIPNGHVFVLGDARDWSNDSRVLGPISLDSVIGTATFVWWPIARFGRLANAR